MTSTSDTSLSFLIGEEDYPEMMRTKVATWRERHLHSVQTRSYDGTILQYYYALQPPQVQAKGSVVVLHGYCEFVGKYRELLYVFYQAGYHVFFHEQRGHGRSGRAAGVGPENVYVGSFREYEKDLKFLLDTRYLPLSGKSPLYLFAHSMGGAVASLFLEDYPGYFDAAVLSSPMHEMVMGDGSLPLWKIRAILTYARVSKKDKKPLPGSKGFDRNAKLEDSCAMSGYRFVYYQNLRIHYPEYRTSDATFGWIRAGLTAQKRIRRHAHRVQVPVLLFQAGNDTLVKPQAQLVFAHRSGNTQVIRFEGVKHELMNAAPDIRREYYRAIFHFLDKH